MRVNAHGKRLSTCPQILMIQKAFLQRFTSYELLSVIKLLGFLLFFVERDFLQKNGKNWRRHGIMPFDKHHLSVIFF